MHDQLTFKILSETQNGYIGRCDCCHQYNFVYNNLLIAFSEDGLLNFLTWLQQNRLSGDTNISLYNGRSKVYSSPHSNLFLAFDDTELTEIETMAAEVRLLLETAKVLKGIL